MIEVDQLTKTYVGKKAVDNISFEIGKGEIVGFLGANGAGKSTTMKILTSFLPPTSGSAKVNGHDVFSDSIQSRASIGYMPENVPLYLDMRVKEYLRFRGGLKGLSGRKLRQRVGEVMDLCSLTERRRSMISSLSKGYRQRVGLADALIHEPEVLILDEPTNGLDPRQIRQFRQIIKDLGGRQTVLVSTHILSEVEATCERVIILHQGKIQASDSPENLIAQLRRAGRIHLELHAPPKEALSKLKTINGVRRVQIVEETYDWIRYSLRAESGKDIRQAIYGLCVEQQWKLRELTREQANLEDVFVELTH